MAPFPLRARALAALAAALSLTSCSLVGSGGSSENSSDVVLVTHDSFVLPKRVIARFEQQSGYHLVVHAAGDGGTLTNKLVLTQGDPTGDVAFGVDNTFASRALDATSSRGPTSPCRRRRAVRRARRRRPAGADRQRQRLRQHRHRLVRRPPCRPAALARRPRRAGVRRTDRGARRHHELDRPRLPAGHRRQVRRRLVVVVAEARRQRRDDHRRVDAGLRDRLQPGRRRRPRPDRRLLRLLAGVHRPEGRHELDHEGPARTPASARSSTPVSSPGPPTPRARRHSWSSC